MLYERQILMQQFCEDPKNRFEFVTKNLSADHLAAADCNESAVSILRRSDEWFQIYGQWHINQSGDSCPIKCAWIDLEINSKQEFSVLSLMTKKMQSLITLTSIFVKIPPVTDKNLYLNFPPFCQMRANFMVKGVPHP